jgi:hypothetical protein
LGVQDRVDVVLSQITVRKGDVLVLCSDGLHGPVVDQEIQEVLAAEIDLKKAAEGLLQKALERDGPDNITVVLARFDGAGLSPAAPEDKVGFVAYEPGRDAEDETGPVSSLDAPDQSGVRRTAAGTAVVSASSVDTTEETGRDADGGRRGKNAARGQSKAGGPRLATRPRELGYEQPARNGRSVVALFFLALLAATAGGIFVLRCERNQAVRSEAARP